MKKLVVLVNIFTCFFLVACSAPKTETSTEQSEEKIEIKNEDAYSKIAEEDILSLTSIIEINWNPLDSAAIYARSTDVALVTIESIDGGDNQEQNPSRYISPFTYGKMNVEEVYKGDMTSGTRVAYVRQGGIIPFEDYLESLDSKERNHLEKNEETDKPKYVKEKFMDDIDVEVGKSYLVYLEAYDHYPIENLPVYQIFGWEGGLREVSKDSKSEGEMKVLNNITGKWESLDEVIAKH